MDRFLQDLRFSLRLLTKTPGFSSVVILTLALGLGVNAAIFSLVNAVLLRPLPYYSPDRLVRITDNTPGVGVKDIGFSVPEFQDLKAAGIFEEISASWSGSANLTGAERPTRLEALIVSPDYFPMFGVKAQLGRMLGPQDTTRGYSESVVISDGLWRQSFGRDPGVVGRKLRLDNDLYNIVGVAPRDFHHPGRTAVSDVDLWVSCGFSAPPFSVPTRNIRIMPGTIGRLKPGVSYDQAREGLSSLVRHLQQDYPKDYPVEAKWAFQIQPLQESLVGNVRPLLLVLMGSVCLIVFMASVNTANLMLARASGRQKEMAIRLALGANLRRIVTQMLIESMILALIAGVVGVMAALGSLNFALRFLPTSIPRFNEIVIDWRVVFFVFLNAVLAGVVAGLAPAVQAARSKVISANQGAQGIAYSVRTQRIRAGFIAAELAITMVLMVGAGLLLRTFWGLLQENPGFNPVHLVTAETHLAEPNEIKNDPYTTPEAQSKFIRDVLRRMASIPGASASAIATNLPLSTAVTPVVFMVEGHPVEDLAAAVIAVSPDYFKAMQTPLMGGRFFDDQDEIGKQEVAIIDETTAKRFWPNEDPMGKRLRVKPDSTVPWLTLPWTTVVGVTGIIKQDGLDIGSVLHIYTAIYQHPTKALSLLMRTPVPPARVESQIRAEIQSIDPALPVFDVRSMSEVIGESMAARRFSAELVGVFAVLAVVLASVGIYGLISFVVSQSSREIGIRIAMGAPRVSIFKVFLIKGMLPAMAGIVIGFVFAALAARLIGKLLYGVSSSDFAVFLAVPVLLGTAAGLATYVPAWRATRVNPVEALRQD
jgi:putative ABC transport system permease protein